MSRLYCPFYYDRRTAANRVDADDFWAVLIGIDAYIGSPLHGCAADVTKMKHFLTDYLRVPDDHIRCLVSTHLQPPILSNDAVDSSPTRANIIEALIGLSVDPRIQNGDNIVIYFSGHGTSYLCSDYYTNGIGSMGTVEAICPVDKAAGTPRQVSVPDICDREINAILTEISHRKGHHITVILDCCFSAGTTRYPDGQSRRVRRASPLPPSSIEDMFNAAHTRLQNFNDYHPIHDQAWSPDLSCHVVLAACREYEHANEDERENGIFTHALINALKSNRLDERSTYSDLIDMIGTRVCMSQMPVVAGEHKNARLWYKN